MLWALPSVFLPFMLGDNGGINDHNQLFGVNFKLKSPLGSMALVFLQAPECSEWPCPMCRQTNNIVECSSYESVDLMKQVIRLLFMNAKVVVCALNV